jgi:periplasmic protein CpxP/Spy
MKRTLTLATLLFAALGAVSIGPAYAQDAAPMGNGRGVRLVEHRLNLTDTQRAQIKSILQQERPTIQQLAATLAQEHAELIALTTFDDQKTVAIAQKYADTHTAATVEREKVRDEICAVLTPEQQQKLQVLRSRFGTLIDQKLQTLGDNL